MDRYHGLPALYYLLDHFAHQNAIKSYLEIGVRDGASLACVLAAAPPSIERIVLCDTWESSYGGTGRASHQHIEVLLAALGRRERNVTFLDGDAAVNIPHLRGQHFDLITIDGDHSLEGITSDLVHTVPLLAPSGVLVVDDTNNPQHPYIADVVDDYIAEGKLRKLTGSTAGVGAIALGLNPAYH